MVEENNQNVFVIHKDASNFAEFEISEFEISRFDCIMFDVGFPSVFLSMTTRVFYLSCITLSGINYIISLEWGSGREKKYRGLTTTMQEDSPHVCCLAPQIWLPGFYGNASRYTYTTGKNSLQR